MAKTTQLQIRMTEAEKSDMRETAAAGGWRNIAEMLRDLVSRARTQSEQRLPGTAQSLPVHPDDEPPL